MKGEKTLPRQNKKKEKQTKILKEVLKYVQLQPKYGLNVEKLTKI